VFEEEIKKKKLEKIKFNEEIEIKDVEGLTEMKENQEILKENEKIKFDFKNIFIKKGLIKEEIKEQPIENKEIEKQDKNNERILLNKKFKLVTIDLNLEPKIKHNINWLSFPAGKKKINLKKR
jgi:hypothetical protein